MKVTELTEFAKTGFESKYLLVLTDKDQMLLAHRGSIKEKIYQFSQLVQEGIVELMQEHYKERIAKEEEYANSLIQERFG